MMMMTMTMIKMNLDYDYDDNDASDDGDDDYLRNSYIFMIITFVLTIERCVESTASCRTVAG